MTIRNLHHALHPKSIAVIGASTRAGSVGRVVVDNIVSGGFEGEIFPVNPKYREVAGHACVARVGDIPGVPEIAVIMTPPETVPGLVAELGEKGTKVAVVITAGLTAENGLRQAMLDAAKPHMLRVIGPNTVGLMIPPAKLNAGFAHMAAEPGGIALLSQSGAIATSLIDWAADNRIGFTQIVSLGDMADVDVGDYLDLLANDAATRAIVMYLESIPNPRKFMSAARAASRLKPLVAIKPGRHAEAAKAAATHTGALSGADRVVDSALRRAGVLRVNGLAELFDATETLAHFPAMQRARVGIVSNGGGAGVLAVDQLIEWGGEVADLSPRTLALLDTVLPRNWSHGNPVDIIGDAPAERYVSAVMAVAADTGVDALLVLNCPTGLASPVEAARAVASLASDGVINGKPVLACWLGEHTAREGRRVLHEAGVASYETPAEAATAISYLVDWSRAQKALVRVPEHRSEDMAGNRDRVQAIFDALAHEGRRMLTESEAKAALEAYGVPVPEIIVVRTPAEAEAAAERLMRTGASVVVKLLSRTITHKSDVGGVVLNLTTPRAVLEAARAIEERTRAIAADAFDGLTVQPMVVRKHAQELIIGVSRDPIFGPVVLFGSGGVAVEVTDDTAIALPPLDDVLAGDLIDQTRIGRLLAGFRDRKPADRAAIVRAINAVSELIIEFPCIAGMDINPLLADSDGVMALDARIEIDPERVGLRPPNPDLVIRPYPAEWETKIAFDTGAYLIRPIKPADVSLYPPFLAKVTPEDMRMRFFTPRKALSDDMLIRLTQLDYERSMAFVALDERTGDLGGIVRLSCDPEHQSAEYAILVRSDLHRHGLGRALLRHLIDYAKADGLANLEGAVLNENSAMLAMNRELGFEIARHPTENGASIVRLDLARWRPDAPSPGVPDLSST